MAPNQEPPNLLHVPQYVLYLMLIGSKYTGNLPKCYYLTYYYRLAEYTTTHKKISQKKMSSFSTCTGMFFLNLVMKQFMT